MLFQGKGSPTKTKFVTLTDLTLKRSSETKKILAISFVVLMAISSILVSPVRAAPLTLVLPSIPVTMEAFNDTNSYFNISLTNVLGSEYSITNRVYLGWCVDRTRNMTRSPALHQVTLYSSLNPPQGELAGQNWTMVNYILNHKQGNASDIQDAIWYFVNFDANGYYLPPTNVTAWAMVNDALANGTGFVPGYGQTVSIILSPVVILPPNTDVQITVIETRMVLIGDVTGQIVWQPDGKVDIRDVSTVAKLFGINYPAIGYQPVCDFNGDGKINIIDISTVAKHFGDHYP